MKSGGCLSRGYQCRECGCAWHSPASLSLAQGKAGPAWMTIDIPAQRRPPIFPIFLDFDQNPLSTIALVSSSVFYNHRDKNPIGSYRQGKAREFLHWLWSIVSLKPTETPGKSLVSTLSPAPGTSVAYISEIAALCAW